MCRSKSTQTPPPPPTTTTTTAMTTTTEMTTRAPANDGGIDCPSVKEKCRKSDENDAFCTYKGQCCFNPYATVPEDTRFCVCFEGYMEKFCHRRKAQALGSREEMQGTRISASFGGFLGVVVIVLFVTLIFLVKRRNRRVRNRREAIRNEYRNVDAPGRCFSAYAASGGGAGGDGEEGGGEGEEAVGENTTFYLTGIQEAEENDNKEKTVPDQKTEDKVK